MVNESMPFSAPAPEKHGFFGGKHDDTTGASLNDLSMQINNLSRRLRILEERYTTMRKKTQATDENVLGLNKNLMKEMKVSHEDVVDFRREFYDLRDKVKLIVKELKDCAKADEVKVLERYINLWEPVNFVTRQELDRMLDEREQQEKPVMRVPPY